MPKDSPKTGQFPSPGLLPKVLAVPCRLVPNCGNITEAPHHTATTGTGGRSHLKTPIDDMPWPILLTASYRVLHRYEAHDRIGRGRGLGCLPSDNCRKGRRTMRHAPARHAPAGSGTACQGLPSTQEKMQQKPIKKREKLKKAVQNLRRLMDPRVQELQNRASERDGAEFDVYQGRH